MDETITPGVVCHALLAALVASDGRRKKRKRDTTADSIGMAIKRELLERGAREAPPADEFEAWLMQQCEELGRQGGYGSGAVRAMARDLFAEWQLALAAPSFREWLSRGAPSADAEET
jgi:hypothetical protein